MVAVVVEEEIARVSVGHRLEEALVVIRFYLTAKREICWRIPTEGSHRSKRVKLNYSTTVRKFSRFTKRRNAEKVNKIYQPLEQI